MENIAIIAIFIAYSVIVIILFYWLIPYLAYTATYAKEDIDLAEGFEDLVGTCGVNHFGEFLPIGLGKKEEVLWSNLLEVKHEFYFHEINQEVQEIVCVKPSRDGGIRIYIQ